MTRSASTLDRLAALVFGLALIAAGCRTAGVEHRLDRRHPADDHRARAGHRRRDRVVAVGGGRRRHRAGGDRAAVAVHPHPESESQRSAPVRRGRRIDQRDLGEVADAAARVLGQSTQAHSAKGRAIIDRGTRTIDLTVTAHSPTTLSALIESIDSVNTQIAGMLGDPTIATRTSIHIDKHPRRDRVE